MVKFRVAMLEYFKWHFIMFLVSFLLVSKPTFRDTRIRNFVAGVAGAAEFCQLYPVDAHTATWNQFTETRQYSRYCAVGTN